ncbi:MAG: hypothetical protein ABJA86_13015 [Nocardioidaceae bacterium]
MTTRKTTQAPKAEQASRDIFAMEERRHDLSPTEIDLMHAESAANPSAGVGSTGSAPSMSPPRTAGGTAAQAAGATISGQQVTNLWAEATNRNAWAHLETAGWKKLSPLSDTGSTTMTLLAAHARATQSAPYLGENPAGTIDVMYVW